VETAILTGKPGEGQHHIVPKRPDPLGANATPQYALLSSTAAAAGLASYAARRARHVSPHVPVSTASLFVRASARLGLCAMAVGAAVNAYFHLNFTTVVVSAAGSSPTPAKLWERTDRYTVEDGCLAGAALGFASFLPTLFLRRPSVPWWTRMVGMTNAGACAGLVAAHGYFQYTGERQKAVDELQRLRQRRNLEFHMIFWDKMLMSQFDVFVQAYVRHNGILRAYHLPAEVYQKPEKFGIGLSSALPGNGTTAEEAAQDERHYIGYIDYAEHLSKLDVEHVKAEIEFFEQEKCALLDEAEYMAWALSCKQYDYIHTPPSTDDERQTRARELQIMSIIGNRLRARADEMDRRMVAGVHWLRHKAAMESKAARPAWLTPYTKGDPLAHNPALSLAEFKIFQDQIAVDIQSFEARILEGQRRDKWSKDLDDARTMLRAADRVTFEMEKKVKGFETKKNGVKRAGVDEPPDDSLEPEKP